MAAEVQKSYVMHDINYNSHIARNAPVCCLSKSLARRPYPRLPLPLVLAPRINILVPFLFSFSHNGARKRDTAALKVAAVDALGLARFDAHGLQDG